MMRFATMMISAVAVSACGSSVGPEGSAEAASYQQAVDCHELVFVESMIRSQLETIEAERGLEIASKHTGGKWEAEAMRLGLAEGLSPDQVEKDLSEATGAAMTAFQAPFQSAPDPDDLIAAAEENFDKIYECSEQAKTLALPEEATS